MFQWCVKNTPLLYKFHIIIWPQDSKFQKVIRMTIGKHYKHKVVTALRSTSVYKAAQLMKQNNIGNIVVVDETGNIPVGIFTDRDVAMKIVADEIDPCQLTIGDAMCQDLLILREDQSVQEAVDMMCAKKVRRAPIVDQNNKIIGIVTVDDLILLFADELGSIAKLIRQQIFK